MQLKLRSNPVIELTTPELRSKLVGHRPDPSFTTGAALDTARAYVRTPKKPMVSSDLLKLDLTNLPDHLAVLKNQKLRDLLYSFLPAISIEISIPGVNELNRRIDEKEVYLPGTTPKERTQRLQQLLAGAGIKVPQHLSVVQLAAIYSAIDSNFLLSSLKKMQATVIKLQTVGLDFLRDEKESKRGENPLNVLIKEIQVDLSKLQQQLVSNLSSENAQSQFQNYQMAEDKLEILLLN